MAGQLSAVSLVVDIWQECQKRLCLCFCVYSFAHLISTVAGFFVIGEAYQVLGDEERREAYDTLGKSATADMPLIDSSMFFMMLFGSDEFEPYVGKLKMAMYVEMMDSNTKEVCHHIMISYTGESDICRSDS